MLLASVKNKLRPTNWRLVIGKVYAHITKTTMLGLIGLLANFAIIIKYQDSLVNINFREAKSDLSFNNIILKWNKHNT